MRKYTSYQKWVMAKFKGSTPKNSIDRIIDLLLAETKQDTFPVKLSLVAKEIGIKPNPLYINQPYSGSLVLHENKVRIALRKENENHSNLKLSPQVRFTYAHELIHCLAYDLTKVPHERIAPLPMGTEEETLCNYGAVKMILPIKILKKYLSERPHSAASSNISYIEKIRQISSVSECSIHAVVLELFNSDLFRSVPNRLYILSQISTGYQNKNPKKPRCIVAIHYDNDGIKNNFLRGLQGLQHLKPCTSSIDKWSLLKIFENPMLMYMIIKDECIQRDTDNKKFLISGTHVRISNYSYIWSELVINEFRD